MIVPAEHRFGRLRTRASIRDKHRLPKHGRDTQIPEDYVPESWLDATMPHKALYAFLLLLIAVIGLPLGVEVGKVIVSAIWG